MAGARAPEVQSARESLAGGRVGARVRGRACASVGRVHVGEFVRGREGCMGEGAGPCVCTPKCVRA